MFQVTTVLPEAHEPISKAKLQDKVNNTPVALDQQLVDYKRDMFGKPAFLSVSG